MQIDVSGSFNYKLTPSARFKIKLMQVDTRRA